MSKVIEFHAVPETLSDQSEVWNVRGVQDRPEVVTVVQFNCVDQEHADALVELLNGCVEVSVEHAPVLPAGQGLQGPGGIPGTHPLAFPGERINEKRPPPTGGRP